ncbi:hypothetical protein FB45DRAFT_934345 [Roridomyces roridus]|uniref:Uncharacterized protein n=1 Tax=Roridomyces roridus TaxID=1738132 RepID=A0AAD7FCY2_9AGAR|nr:hypothetical protein FB45DRAFT_934345 [Roridomyces roridus]
MHRSPIGLVIICLAMGFGFDSVHAGLQNFTVDDTSPDVVYGGTTFQCNAASPCKFGGNPVGEGIVNASTTYTNDSITFTFTGVAYYTTFDLIGTVAVVLDNAQSTTESSFLTDPNATFTHTVSWGPSGSNAQHVLSIIPVGETLVSTPDKKSHTGAIVGGVIGALAVIAGVLLAILFSRRHKLILKRNQRKSAVIRKMALSGRHREFEGEVEQTDQENAK